jgi:hypothetical protein
MGINGVREHFLIRPKQEGGTVLFKINGAETFISDPVVNLEIRFLYSDFVRSDFNPHLDTYCIRALFEPA